MPCPLVAKATVAHLLRTSLTSLSSPKFWIESHLRPPGRTARYRRRRRRLATLWMSPGPAEAVNHSAASLSPSPPEESSWGGPQPRPRPRPPCLGRTAPRTIPAIPDHSSPRSPSPAQGEFHDRMRACPHPLFPPPLWPRLRAGDRRPSATAVRVEHARVATAFFPSPCESSTRDIPHPCTHSVCPGTPRTVAQPNGGRRRQLPGHPLSEPCISSVSSGKC